ncbi:hypothetical protein ACLK19_16350 [Escherichia coli]
MAYSVQKSRLGKGCGCFACSYSLPVVLDSRYKRQVSGDEADPGNAPLAELHAPAGSDFAGDLR